MFSPLGLIYGTIAGIRRWLYGVLGLRKVAVLPTWVVGNLAVGGSGKTPMVIAMVQALRKISPIDLKIATLSRGYGRKTRGFLEVMEVDSARYGDEPSEIYLALGQQRGTGVFIGEDRKEAIVKIREKGYDVVILDDGMQHLPLKADGYILVSEFSRLPDMDFCMPAGRLREFPNYSEKADYVVITQCPKEMDLDIMEDLYRRLVPFIKNRAEIKQRVLFVGLGLDLYRVNVTDGSLDLYGGEKITDNLAFGVCGIAHGERAIESWKSWFTLMEYKNYSDHYKFHRKEVVTWVNRMNDLGISNFVCTRKDWMRLIPYSGEFGSNFTIWVVSSKPDFTFGDDTFNLMLHELLNERSV